MKLKAVLIFSILFFSVSAFSQKSDTATIEVQNAGPQVNSAYSDYGPVITSDGSLLIYTSRRPTSAKDIQKQKESNEQVYSAKYNSKTKTWSEATLMEAPVNIEGRNNSAITVSNDGQRMLLYRDDSQGNGDIYESLLSGNEWSEPVKLPEPINSKYHESSASISPDGRTIYFVSRRPAKSSRKEDKNIWYCTQDENGKWGEAMEIGDSINTKEDEEMPFIHPNGKTLFFSSKGHATLGGYDVFMTTYDEDTKAWSKPENLEQPINSIGDDVGFVMKANGKTGYYSSPREGGMGEKDIYKIIFHKDIMKKHLTLFKGRIFDHKGKPLSSQITVKDKTTGTLIGKYTSNSATGEYLISLPEGKIYEIEVNSDDYFTYKETLDIPRSKGFNEIDKDITMKTKYAYLTGRVLDENGSPLRAQIEVELIDSLTHESIGKYKTDADGRYSIKVKPGRDYNVVFNRSGHFFQSVKAQVPNKPGYELNLGNSILQKLDIGKKVVLENIFFDVGKATLRSESISELERALKMMNDMKTLEIEISGHTDNKGSAVSNKALSENRAKMVVDYLISKGIDPARLQSAGYGSQFPVASNDTEEGRQLNRRTEFKVTKIDMDAEQMAELERLKTAFVEGAKKENTSNGKKKKNARKIPEEFKDFDSDNDGSISAADVFALIDSYFEGGTSIKFQDITDLIDYYLDE
jgi:outer membrane protein OmpA-like peptidoglycan-associated protein/protocatechuate 3,4-dioxygenase beta subunit